MKTQKSWWTALKATTPPNSLGIWRNAPNSWSLTPNVSHALPNKAVGSRPSWEHRDSGKEEGTILRFSSTRESSSRLESQDPTTTLLVKHLVTTLRDGRSTMGKPDTIATHRESRMVPSLRQETSLGFLWTWRWGLWHFTEMDSIGESLSKMSSSEKDIS